MKPKTKSNPTVSVPMGHAELARELGVDRQLVVSLPMGYAELARELGVDRQLVWGWFQPGRHVPAKWVPDVARITKLPRVLFRPDIYQDEEAEIAS